MSLDKRYVKTMIDMLVEGRELQITSIGLDMIGITLNGEFDLEDLKVTENEYGSSDELKVYDVRLKTSIDEYEDMYCDECGGTACICE